ncbi:MAG: NapC/NirT family cytochrome c [Chloroflexi bacterium]|nr:NapC/NirT family cytochrome c [Chloroflexota bacterium]
MFRRLWDRFRSISRRAWAFTGIGTVVSVVLLAGILVGWDYTNSPPFCGTTCHTMPPEYTAYLVSPHARVSCVECHIGRTFIGNAFTRKAGDMMHVVRMLSANYEVPIYAKGMQPASESCEKCHWPQKFADDKVKLINHYAADEQNSLATTLLTMKTGGGTTREGRGLGIHWHIENEITYVATDELDQNIPWVQVKDETGKVTVYADVEKPLTPDQIAKAEKKEMSCITCHNRISHTFRSPEQVIDQALSSKRLDVNMPAIARKSVEVLSTPYKSADEAKQAIEGLDGFYKKEYADYYARNTKTVQNAIAFLKTSYETLVFPSEEISWTTHPDNIGHKNSSGCFRCHDGKHFTQDNSKAIRLECNICHTLPQVYTSVESKPSVTLAKGLEPESHAKTTWLIEHRAVFNETCQQCHDTRNPGSKDNSSFCSNVACHGVKWTYAGLNAPGLAKVFPAAAPRVANPNATPPNIPHPIGGKPDCLICHGQKSTSRPAPTSHATIDIALCLDCHKPSFPPPASEVTVTGPPTVPHDLAGRAECLGCHNGGGAKTPQVPKFHLDFKFTNSNCLTCHALKLNPNLPKNVGFPALPASHAGRSVCLACHAEGVLGAKKLPTSHAGRVDSACLTCHQPK